jgi:hypothetical protein
MTKRPVVLTRVVGANLQSPIPSHHQSSLPSLLVLQKSHISRTALLPLAALTIEFEEFGAHFKSLLLVFFIGLGFDLFGQTDDRFEVDVWFVGFGVVVLFTISIPLRTIATSYLVGILLL